MSDRGRSPAPSGGSDPRRGSSGSRPPSGGGSRGSSPAPSGSGQPGPSAAPGWTAGPGFDPAKPASSGLDKPNTRMELPPEAYLLDKGKDAFCLRGQKYNTEGTQDLVHTNSIRITKVNLDKKIHQFDVSLAPACLKGLV